MAMIFGALNGQMIGWANVLQPAPEVAGVKMANAFYVYARGATNIAGGSFIGMPGISALRAELGSIFRAQYPSGSIAGSRAGTAIVNCLITLRTVYQIGPPTPVYRGGFIGQMSGIFNTLHPSGIIFANRVSKAIQTLCRTTQVSGVVPGTPPWYFRGPLS